MNPDENIHLTRAHLTAHVAGSGLPILTCLHVTSEWVESTDGVRALRVPLSPNTCPDPDFRIRAQDAAAAARTMDAPDDDNEGNEGNGSSVDSVLVVQEGDNVELTAAHSTFMVTTAGYNQHGNYPDLSVPLAPLEAGSFMEISFRLRHLEDLLTQMKAHAATPDENVTFRFPAAPVQVATGSRLARLWHRLCGRGGQGTPDSKDTCSDAVRFEVPGTYGGVVAALTPITNLHPVVVEPEKPAATS